MTDDFKNILFKYLTGSLEDGSPTYDEIFESVKNIPRSAFNGYLPTNVRGSWFNFEGMVKVNNSDNIILYGGYKTTSNEVRGIIILLDGNFIPIRTYYEFNNGTKLRYITAMIQEEDGNFTFIDSTSYVPYTARYGTDTKRFVMVNNFATAGGDIIYKTSYNIPTQQQYINELFKDNNSSTYVMVAEGMNSNDEPYTRVTTLKINVGSANKWKAYASAVYYSPIKSYCEFNNEGQPLIKVLIRNFSADVTTPYLWQKGFAQSSFTLKTLASIGRKVIQYTGNNDKAVFKDANTIYYVNDTQKTIGAVETKYIGLYKINLANNTNQTICDINLGSYSSDVKADMCISLNNGSIYVNYIDNVGHDGDYFTADYYFQRLDNDIWDPIFVQNNKFAPIFDGRKLYINDNYNIVNAYLYTNAPFETYNAWNMINLKEIYNLSNYNGEPYESQNALIPHSATLYSNNTLVFARNLYNSVVQGATTISSVEIPNTYLNDTIVDESNLISLTNENLVKDTRTIEKNIYEKLDINFIDTLSIIDKNDLDSPVLNPLGASLLNSRINTQNQFNDTKISKIVVNYIDETSKELGFEVVENGRLATYTFLLKTEDLEVSNIQFISNDGNIIYHTINGENFELNKTYQITQEMEVI